MPYISMTVCESQCEGQDFAPDGFPKKCDRSPVWELSHSNGMHIRLCEYHIECYWSYWHQFRDAVRDVWPVRQHY
jgi:hypothetical protein